MADAQDETYYVVLQNGTQVNAADVFSKFADDEALINDHDASLLWIILAGALVFYMHLGFSMLEAGSVSMRNVQNILLKNVMNCCIGTVVWFCVGWGVAYGGAEDGEFIGKDEYWGQISEENYGSFFFQWAFCVTASTIVSGAVAERIKLSAFFIICVVLTGFIYPIVVHWVWDGEGWLCAFNPNAKYSMIDFAGSGVVHMVGGWSALMGAWLCGPRKGRFDDHNPTKYGNHSVPFQLFGTFTLWFGWFGFNCGSTLVVRGFMGVAARVAVTTTLSAAAGGLATTILYLGMNKKFSIGMCCNGILAGLVSITSGCSVVAPGSALLIGFIGGSIYFGFSIMLQKLKIDDPLDASAVHGAGGFWGVLAAGIFVNEKAVAVAYSPELAAVAHGTQFSHQLLGAIVITVWSVTLSGIAFYAMDLIFGLTTDEGSHVEGLDMGEFGMAAYDNQARVTPGGGAQMTAKKKSSMKEPFLPSV